MSGFGEHPAALRVLVVCTGNICRSPMVERVMRHELDRRVGDDARWVEVRSAGTHALTGQQMDPQALTVLADLGVLGCDDFRARQVTEAMVADADLVLAAAREHRAHVVDLVPSAVRRTFTVRELDRLLSGVETGDLPSGNPRVRGRALAEAAASMRGQVGWAEPEADDLGDPYRRPLSEFELTGRLVSSALRRPLDLLTGVAPRARRPSSGRP